MAQTIYLHRFPSQAKPPVKGNSKVCRSCPEKGAQPVDVFYVNNHTVDRRSGTCKACEAKKRAEKEAERKFYTGF